MEYCKICYLQCKMFNIKYSNPHEGQFICHKCYSLSWNTLTKGNLSKALRQFSSAPTHDHTFCTHRVCVRDESIKEFRKKENEYKDDFDFYLKHYKNNIMIPEARLKHLWIYIIVFPEYSKEIENIAALKIQNWWTSILSNPYTPIGKKWINKQYDNFTQIET